MFTKTLLCCGIMFFSCFICRIPMVDRTAGWCGGKPSFNKYQQSKWAGIPARLWPECQCAVRKAMAPQKTCRGQSLDLGLSFVQKAYAINHTDTTLAVLNQRTRNDYLQMPAGAGFYGIHKKLTFFLSGGVYFGYWVHGNVQGAVPNLLNTAAPFPQPSSYNQKYSFDSHRDQRWEFGWQTGGGLSYHAEDGAEPFIGVRFYQSLTDQQKNYMVDQVPRYNRTLAFSFGLIKTIGR